MRCFSSALLLLLLLLLCVGCEAKTIAWTGLVDNQWFNAGNWVPKQVPTLEDDVVIGDAHLKGNKDVVVEAASGASSECAAASLTMGYDASHAATLRIASATSYSYTFARKVKVGQYGSLLLNVEQGFVDNTRGFVSPDVEIEGKLQWGSGTIVNSTVRVSGSVEFVDSSNGADRVDRKKVIEQSTITISVKGAEKWLVSSPVWFRKAAKVTSSRKLDVQGNAGFLRDPSDRTFPSKILVQAPGFHWNPDVEADSGGKPLAAKAQPTGKAVVRGSAPECNEWFEWEGGRSLDWFDPLNWNRKAVPTKHDCVQISYPTREYLPKVNSSTQTAEAFEVHVFGGAQLLIMTDMKVGRLMTATVETYIYIGWHSSSPTFECALLKSEDEVHFEGGTIVNSHISMGGMMRFLKMTDKVLQDTTVTITELPNWPFPLEGQVQMFNSKVQLASPIAAGGKAVIFGRSPDQSGAKPSSNLLFQNSNFTWSA